MASEKERIMDEMDEIMAIRAETRRYYERVLSLPAEDQREFWRCLLANASECFVRDADPNSVSYILAERHAMNALLFGIRRCDWVIVIEAAAVLRDANVTIDWRKARFS